MQPVTTKITQLLSAFPARIVPEECIADRFVADIKTPIVAAPMAFASTPDLASAVTGAGGFGLIAAGKWS